MPSVVSRFQRTFGHVLLGACLAAAVLGQTVPAVAGVTGNITGLVRDAGGAPLADVRVRAVSVSATRSATTDASGHFVILALPPDTYAIFLTKPGYEDAEIPGVTVFADQTLAVAYTVKKALRTIAHVASTGGSSLVNPGVGIDVYSVNASQVAAA